MSPRTSFMAPLAAGPADQAQGLRERFGRPLVVVIPVVSNPFNQHSGLLLERLCAAYAHLGRSTLVVDAGERSPAPKELSKLDLADGIEPLAPRVSYLAARGLPRRFLDARASCADFLTALGVAAPEVQVLLVHAPAAELCRMQLAGAAGTPGEPQALDHQGRPLQVAPPLLLAQAQRESMTQAYTAFKVMHARAGTQVADLAMCACAQDPLTLRVAEQLGVCADRFLGAVLRHTLVLDPEHRPPVSRDSDWMTWATAALHDAPTASVPPWLWTRHQGAAGCGIESLGGRTSP